MSSGKRHIPVSFLLYCFHQEVVTVLNMNKAKDIASRRLEDISGCTEFTNAYMFFNPRSENVIGGFDMPVFVLKESGKLVSALEYYTTMTGEAIQALQF